jgi:hypothetical protein
VSLNTAQLSIFSLIPPQVQASKGFLLGRT